MIEKDKSVPLKLKKHFLNAKTYFSKALEYYITYSPYYTGNHNAPPLLYKTFKTKLRF